MKIKDLIAVLEEMDPEREVYKSYGDHDMFVKKVTGVNSVDTQDPDGQMVAVIR